MTDPKSPYYQQIPHRQEKAVAVQEVIDDLNRAIPAARAARGSSTAKASPRPDDRAEYSAPNARAMGFNEGARVECAVPYPGRPELWVYSDIPPH